MRVVTIRYSSEGYPSLDGADKPMSHCVVQQTGGGGVLYHLAREQQAIVATADVLVEANSDGSGSVSVRQLDGKLIRLAIRGGGGYPERWVGPKRQALEGAPAC